MMQRFASIEGWVFDLDNTLYPASQNLFAQIDKRMTAFIGEALAVERDEAYRLQKQFLGEYGTTLAGLMNKHGLPPSPFLDFVHDIDVSVFGPELICGAGRPTRQKIHFHQWHGGACRAGDGAAWRGRAF